MNRSAITMTLGLVALTLAPGPVAAPRQRLSMDPGWRFNLGDVPGAERPGFDDHGWRRLDLPHDWSVEGTPREDAPAGGRGGYFPTGTGWYRKAFRLPAGSKGREARLDFDGVYMNSDVWINGVHLGRRPDGYVSFSYDITAHLLPGVNVVAVRVDNSQQPNSRWYSGSGIYRHVWLTLGDPLHLGQWGTVVTTPSADSAHAEVVVNTRIENDYRVPRRGFLRSVVLDSAGQEVARAETVFALAAGQKTTVEQRMQMTTPRLWSSIVLWSAGNEIGEQSMPDGVAVLRRLLDLFHREDPTRPVTTGNDNIVADGHPATLAFLSALDIVGYNYVDRWHERRELFADQDRHDHPEWKMIGTESGSIFESFDERYSLGTDSAVVRPNYASGMIQAERLWKWVTLRDYFAGNFMWTGVDYLGESAWPFKGFGSGAIDITGHPKDAYYLYQSLWTDRPVLHLFPHWNWAGRTGQVIPVLAYTNCNSVELFLNGRSLGEKRREFPAQGTSGGWNSYAQPVVRPTTGDLHLSWDVPYEPGVLRAVGKGRDGTIACAAEVRTAGPPAAIRMRADRATLTTDPGDVVQVTLEIVDSAGTVVPAADNLMHVAVTGGSVMALDNANLRDLDPYHSDRRHAFNGRGLAILGSAQPGTLVLTATAEGLRPATLSVPVARGHAPAAIPPAR